jgi:hypothetical protein
MSTYAEPVNQLRNLGAVSNSGKWRDYSELGLGPDHVAELIGMMTDKELNQAGSQRTDVWAPTHAWRALAQMHAVEAIDPFLELLRFLDEEDLDDWAHEDAPKFFTQMGPAALPALERFLNDERIPYFPRWRIAETMTTMAQGNPDLRAGVVAVLTNMLQRAATNPSELNGGLIGCLLDLDAVESLDAIKAAFATRHVDESIAGDLEEVLYDLGLRETKPPARGAWLPARTPPASDRAKRLPSPGDQAKLHRPQGMQNAKNKVGKTSRKRSGQRKRRR